MDKKPTLYERWAKSLGNLFVVKVSEKDKLKIEKDISTARLDLSASEVMVFSLVVLFLTMFSGILINVIIYLFTGFFSFSFLGLVLLVSLFLLYYTYKIPERHALQWRLKASSQMVPAILYIVLYMKHTSNLEKAISFAAQHLEAPLSLDFRKVFWDVEIGRFSTIKQSLDNYLELTWKNYSPEFIEAFHLIESSLYEASEDRRIKTLEKSLQVILDGVYDKMLKYTHDSKSPLTNVYMLGIVLPTLGLALIPLASTMLQGAIQWYHVLIIFNIIVPFFVIYLTDRVLVSRPGGHGDSSFLEQNPLYPEYQSNKYYLKYVLLFLPLFLIGLIPFFWRYTNISGLLGLQRDYTWNQIGVSFLGDSGIFGIMQLPGGGYAGPFGMLSLLLSLFIPLSIALVFIFVYKDKTINLINERTKYKDVEREFTSSLFQLGNRLGDGLPAEIAFSKVAQSTKGTATEGFYQTVNQNIQALGMSLDEAIFNKKRGAIIFYPSHLIATSMRILVESVKKGLQVAARGLISISEYVKNIRKIDDRMNDLLAEIISDMKSNMTFLAPLLAGIVVGLSGMITFILGTLSGFFESGAISSGDVGVGGIQNLMGIFDVTLMLPTYWLQIIVGVYIIEIVFILTSTLVTIQSGKDDLESTYSISKNLNVTILIYSIVSFLAVVGLGLLGAIALVGLS
jgi:MFS family permease